MKGTFMGMDFSALSNQALREALVSINQEKFPDNYRACQTEIKLRTDQGRLVPHEMTTTAFALHGYTVTGEHGLVRGILVRSRSVFGSIGAGIQTIFGGNITILSNLCEKTRNDAFIQMLEHAEELGANAVIGIRYDATEILQGVTEVLCYGTAVTVKKNA